jgi:hypothetical protein
MHAQRRNISEETSASQNPLERTHRHDGCIASAGCYNPRQWGQQQGHEGLRNMHHFYPRGAFYLACMAVGVVLMLLFYFWSDQVWALWVWLWT